MIDLIGLCCHLRSKFPEPANCNTIYAEAKRWSNDILSSEIERDLFAALGAHWRRNGWQWDNNLYIGAAKVGNEWNATFNTNTISLTKQQCGGSITVDVSRNEKDERVKWFN
jgi:hypothetical protein